MFLPIFSLVLLKILTKGVDFSTKYLMRTVNLSLNPQHHDNFHLVYRRPLQPKGDSIWEFMGYRCLNCDRVMKNDITVPKHKLNCRPYERVRPIPEEPTIYNIRGELWTPLEMNQIPDIPNVSLNDNDK